MWRFTGRRQQLWFAKDLKTLPSGSGRRRLDLAHKTNRKALFVHGDLRKEHTVFQYGQNGHRCIFTFNSHHVHPSLQRLPCSLGPQHFKAHKCSESSNLTEDLTCPPNGHEKNKAELLQQLFWDIHIQPALRAPLAGRDFGKEKGKGVQLPSKTRATSRTKDLHETKAWRDGIHVWKEEQPCVSRGIARCCWSAFCRHLCTMPLGLTSKGPWVFTRNRPWNLR